MKYSVILCVVAVLCGCHTHPPKKQHYSDVAPALKYKTMFATQEVQAIAQPFVGIHTTEGIEPGLFPIRSTGVTTKPIVEAAKDFIKLLRPEQEIRTVYGVDDPQWRKWFNGDNGVYARQGISFKEMTATQRRAAMKLMKVSLSAKGLALTDAIRKADHTLGEITDIAMFDEDLYFYTFMGLPSETDPWGWQLQGHHLAINYFVLGDQVVMTPSFFGAEPAVTTTGKYKSNIVLQEEQDEGMAFYLMLDTDQKKKATLSTKKTGNDLQAKPYRDNLVLDYAGLPASELSADQQAALLHLISLYTGNMEDEHARLWQADVKAHIDETWFLWKGEASDTGKYYYRIYSPAILIEFDHQNPLFTKKTNPPGPSRQHIHVVVRTPNGNDYGKDLLREHLEKYHNEHPEK